MNNFAKSNRQLALLNFPMLPKKTQLVQQSPEIPITNGGHDQFRSYHSFIHNHYLPIN